ncbi:hypothetical protein [Deinococcus yavapaiensis]|nr:hypothetical protein [Deinococcus yavapaiensis]
MNRELQALLTHMRQYDLEERTQGQQEADERRRAWHDGRASAYHDIIDRLAALLEEPRIESTDDLASHS